MADFIDFEAQEVDEENEIVMISDDDDEQVKNGENEVSDFIDNSEVDNNDPSFYRTIENNELQNVGNVDEILEEELEQSYIDAESLDLSNNCKSDEELEPEINFAGSDKRFQAFIETFFPKDKQLTLKEAILYSVRFDQTTSTNECSNEQLFEVNQDFNIKLADDLKIELDLRRFYEICLNINEVLIQHNYFLRVYELKKKFREVRLKTVQEKKILRELCSCIKPKFDGFDVVTVQFRRELRKNFKPIDIIYKPVQKKTDPIYCFTSSDISKSYRSICANSKTEIPRTGFAWQCYYCSKFYARKDRFKKHIEACSGIPGIVYNFHTKSLITFEDNLKNKGDLPMTFYFDLETTAPTDNCYNPEKKEMFVVSYVIVVAFHPDLKFKKVICKRSYGHSLHKLNSLSYFTEDQLKFCNTVTLSN